MSTVVKALALLDLFSSESPSLGLSELARRANYDKATTRRFLVALKQTGFVEQDAESKAYRLGPATLRLAQVREAVTPIDAVIRPILAELAGQTGETAHYSLLSGGKLASLGFCESARAHRVLLNHGDVLPFHATASGIAFLAFSSAVDPSKLKLTRYTPHTIVDHAQLRERIAQARRQGFAISRGGFEDEVYSLAAPIFDCNNQAIGAIAVAAPASRVKGTVQASLQAAVLHAAAKAQHGLGGRAKRGAA